jgi:hypothetical protein
MSTASGYYMPLGSCRKGKHFRLVLIYIDGQECDSSRNILHAMRIYVQSSAGAEAGFSTVVPITLFHSKAAHWPSWGEEQM